MIFAGNAGTGKTNTLAARISNIIKSNKAKADEILCITFTNKACAEMRERIEKIVGESAKDITIRTFHSFCFDLIKSEAKKKTDIFSNSIKVLFLLAYAHHRLLELTSIFYRKEESLCRFHKDSSFLISIHHLHFCCCLLNYSDFCFYSGSLIC